MFQRYRLVVYINGTWFRDVLIDNHVEERHGTSVDSLLVLNLVRQLHMQVYVPDDTDNGGFEYFVQDDLWWDGKVYRMVWLIPPERSYIGVRTVFRRQFYGN